MKDGNKESVKEFLSAFRTLSSISLSTILVLTGLHVRQESSLGNVQFYAVAFLETVSLMAAMFLFFLVFPKIHNEDDDIIYLPDVRKTAATSLVAFALANIVLVISLLV